MATGATDFFMVVCSSLASFLFLFFLTHYFHLGSSVHQNKCILLCIGVLLANACLGLILKFTWKNPQTHSKNALKVMPSLCHVLGYWCGTALNTMPTYFLGQWRHITKKQQITSNLMVNPDLNAKWQVTNTHAMHHSACSELCALSNFSLVWPWLQFMRRYSWLCLILPHFLKWKLSQKAHRAE